MKPGRWAFVLVGLVSGIAGAEEECLRDCRSDIDCAVEVVDCLIAAGRARDAVGYAKPLVGEHSGQPAYAHLLARAYLADQNPFWAQRALQKARDCTSRSWLAWVHIQNGNLDLASEALQAPGCPASAAEQARWHLLETFLARTRDDHHRAFAAIGEVPAAGEIYAEDRGLWLFLRREENPGWIEPFSFKLEMGGGYTSNSKAGSPTDPRSEGSHSGLGRLDLFGRLVWPASRLLRPTLEAGLKGHGITVEAARELSYLELSARPGFIFGTKFPRILVGYKADYLVLNRDREIQRRFYEGHRGELEFETGGMTYFTGAGRRIFHENGRTRLEIDGGLGGSLLILDRVRTLLAFSLRYYDAISEQYDLLGGTGLAVASLDLGSGFFTRLGATLGLDYYHNSGGIRGGDAHGSTDTRFDVLAKLSAAIWGPAWRGVRVGLSYDFSWRDSSAGDYSYTEHRLLLKTRLFFDLDPWAPQVVESKGRVALDYGIGEQAGAGLEEERIQDLLRQDEAARRGSSCVN